MRMGDNLPDSMFESFRYYKGAGAKKAVPASGGARDSFGGGPSDDAWADVDLDSIQAQVASSSSSRPAAIAGRTERPPTADGRRLLTLDGLPDLLDIVFATRAARSSDCSLARATP